MLKFENDEVKEKYYEMLKESGVGHVSFGMNTVITEKDLEPLSKDFEFISNFVKEHKVEA